MGRRRGADAVVPAVLAALVVLAATLAVVSRPERARPGLPTAALRTPVLSARRIPVLVRAAIADANLTVALDALLADPVLGAGRGTSCLVVDQGARAIYVRRDDLALIPASNMKLLTAAAALRVLGPAFRFSTDVRVAAPALDGIVEGSLHLVGDGDPLLSTADYAASIRHGPVPTTPLEQLAQAVADAGVREVRGGVVGDESRYDLVRFVPTWKRGYVSEGAVGPMSALSVNDGWSRWQPFVPATAPARNAAEVFTALLRGRGVAVAGGAAEGPAPARTSRLASVSSPPLSEVVGEMLRSSDNMTAELLVKEMGAAAGSGTTAAGVAAMREALGALGLPVADLETVDGSGLDRSDRATCRLLARTLELEGAAGPVGDGLSLAGRTGTLDDRFVGNPAAGRLRAKTGALANVVALSGWMPVASQPALSFSMLANEIPSESVGRALQERLGATLAAYPQAPELALLGPRP